MTDTSHIANFARNEMVRADHTIQWAGDVQEGLTSALFYVRYDNKVFMISVTETGMKT